MMLMNNYKSPFTTDTSQCLSGILSKD